VIDAINEDVSTELLAPANIFAEHVELLPPAKVFKRIKLTYPGAWAYTSALFLRTQLSLPPTAGMKTAL